MSRNAWRETYIFREVLPPLPKGWEPGHWQVEAHRETTIEAYCCPVGIAWVNCVGVNNGMLPFIEFVHVLPQFQRQGVALRLMQACAERWPDITCTDGINPAGEMLAQRFHAWRVGRFAEKLRMAVNGEPR